MYRKLVIYIIFSCIVFVKAVCFAALFEGAQRYTAIPSEVKYLVELTMLDIKTMNSVEDRKAKIKSLAETMSEKIKQMEKKTPMMAPITHPYYSAFYYQSILQLVFDLSTKSAELTKDSCAKTKQDMEVFYYMGDEKAKSSPYQEYTDAFNLLSALCDKI